MESKKNNRAAKGGQTGMNGEWYAGGTFLPNTELGKMARGSRNGGGKMEVAPYKWEVAPAAGMRPLFQQFRDIVNIQTGAVNEQAAAYYRRDVSALRKMHAAWVAGIRWVAVE